MSDRECTAREQLKAQLTPEFLSTLVEASRVLAWRMVDYTEVLSFVEEVHLLKGAAVPPEVYRPYTWTENK